MDLHDDAIPCDEPPLLIQMVEVVAALHPTFSTVLFVAFPHSDGMRGANDELELMTPAAMFSFGFLGLQLPALHERLLGVHSPHTSCGTNLDLGSTVETLTRRTLWLGQYITGSCIDLTVVRGNECANINARHT